MDSNSGNLLDAILTRGDLDIQKLDGVIQKFYQYNDSLAQKILLKFRSELRAWEKVPKILQYSSEMETKFLAIDILRDTVQYRWRVLPPKEQQGMRHFTHKSISNYVRNDRNSPLLKRMNLVFVAIAKQEWPRNWATVIQELVQSARSSEQMCENHMDIIQNLTQDIFQFEKGLTHNQLELRKKQMMKEFHLIFNLIIQVFEKSNTISLLQKTLQCLASLLPWIPRNLIFESPLFRYLVSKLLAGGNGGVLKNDIFNCLNEVASMCSEKHEQQSHQMFDKVLQVTLRSLPPDKLNGAEPVFVSKFTLFLKLFLSNHTSGVERRTKIVLLSNQYMLKASYINDRQLFKICLDYWNFLVKDLRFHEQRERGNSALMVPSKFSSSRRKDLYGHALEELRKILVTKMAKPKEVIIMEDENGEVTKRIYDDVDSSQLYKDMRSTIRTLTQLDPLKMLKIMKTRLNQLVNARGFSKDNLNSLCWAVGAVSGSMARGMEEGFIIVVIKTLLDFVKRNLGRQNKAWIASGIMYVVQQYPRFLVLHWKFLRAVVMKLFEFMHVTFTGVQEMACDTFLIISKETKHQFVKLHPQQPQPFILDILANVGSISSDLSGDHLHVFYEAIGLIVDQVPSKNLKEFFRKFMTIPNKYWQEILVPSQLRKVRFPASLNSSDNVFDSIHPKTKEIMLNGENVEQIKNLLKTNSAIAKSCKKGFIFQMELMFGDLLKVYRFYSLYVSRLIREKGPGVSNHHSLKKMRAIKSGILKTLENFVKHSDESYKLKILKEYVSPFLTMILEDYSTSVPIARDPNTLAVLTACIEKYQIHMVSQLPSILETVLSATLPLIVKDLQNFPDHRTNLFRLLRSVNKHCFQTFFKIPKNGMSVVMKSILWAIKHREPSNYEEGLNILHEMILNIKFLNNPQTTNVFFREYYIMIFYDVFHVFSDNLHTTAVGLQGKILRQLFIVVLCNVVTIPLRKGSSATNSSHSDNKLFLRDYFAKLLNQSFRNLTKQQIGTFIMKCFEYCMDEDRFAKHMKDFLIECRIYTNKSNYARMFETLQAITTGQGEDRNRGPGRRRNDGGGMRALPQPPQQQQRPPPPVRDLGELPTRQNDMLALTDGRTGRAPPIPPQNMNHNNHNNQNSNRGDEEMMMLMDRDRSEAENRNGQNNRQNQNNQNRERKRYNEDDVLLALPAPGSSSGNDGF